MTLRRTHDYYNYMTYREHNDGLEPIPIYKIGLIDIN